MDLDEIRRLPPKPNRTIRFFKKSNIFFAIDDDAELIAQKYIRSIGALKKGSDNGVYVTISEALYASLLRDLLLYNRTSIELYEFEVNKWTKAIEASPGNITQVIDLMNNELDISSTSMLLAISSASSNEPYHFNAACCDPTLFTISTTDFIDTPTLCNFESLITQTMPSEIIFFGIQDSIVKTMKVISDKFQIPQSIIENTKVVDYGQFPNTKSMKALLSTLTINLSEFKHQHFQLHEFMTVDYSAVNALNIFPEDKSPKIGLPTSLYQLLNDCVTPMGSRLLHQYLQQPLLDADKINKRLEIVEAFSLNLDVSIKIKNIMKQLPDIARLIRKFIAGKGNLQDCVRLYDISSVVPQLMELNNIENEDIKKIVEEIESVRDEVEKVHKLVSKTIDFSMIPQHIYRIAPDFDDDLTDISKKMNEKQRKMECLKDDIAEEIGLDSDKIKLERATNQKQFYFRITRALERNIRGNDDLTILEARKDGVHFTSYKLNKIANEFFELETEYTTKQKEIVHKLITTVSEFTPVFQTLDELFAQIDVFIAFANVANSCNFVKPVISRDSKEIYLKQARHPLVEKRCTNFMPNTIRLEKGKSSFCIISGPNSAGKSTLMKTVGICTFLSHIGSFVPCDSAIIPVTSSIHARVGAWDSIHISTFAVEMTEMAGILESAQTTSLIIVDELGRSTSSSDGFGLAWAISKKIATEISAFTLFATHFHELCNLEKEIDCVANFHMDASVDDGILMLYQLKPGPFSKSFGIEAAEHAGFPTSVMKRAKEKAVELELADSEDESVPKRVCIDQNEPYVNFLTKILEIDYENMSMNDTISTIENALKIFDEQKEKSMLGKN